MDAELEKIYQREHERQMAEAVEPKPFEQRQRAYKHLNDFFEWYEEYADIVSLPQVSRDGSPGRALLNRYGLTGEMYAQLLAEQGGVCALCRKAPDPDGYLATDHDHLTGEVRGLLCNFCNSLIGKVDMCTGWLRKSESYLIKSRCNRATRKQ